MGIPKLKQLLLLCLTVWCGACSKPGSAAEAQPTQLVVDLSIRHQHIDGFGTTSSPALGDTSSVWYADLYYRDLGASIFEVV